MYKREAAQAGGAGQASKGFILISAALNYTSVSSSSCCSCRPFVAFRLCCLRGSKASTTICSVPLISARQNGQPCSIKRIRIKFFIIHFAHSAYLSLRVHLPGGETGRAQQMTAGLDAYILIVLGADFA